MVSLGNKKLALIQAIMNVNDEQDLLKIEQKIRSVTAKEQEDKFGAAIKPVKQSVTIEEMIAQQNYQPLKKNTFHQKVKAIEEPLEDLLSMLKP